MYIPTFLDVGPLMPKADEKLRELLNDYEMHVKLGERKMDSKKAEDIRKARQTVEDYVSTLRRY